MIFQEPMTALSPVFTVGEQIREVVELHRGLRGRPAWGAVVESLREVGIPDPTRRADEYPHQFSGGMRQRVMIAMSLAGEPELLIADEPTTALDVTVQQQILDLLRSLKDQRGMSLLLITHDLGLVGDVADEVYVMYAGRIVEHGPVREVLDRPLHPYTQGLLRCTPKIADRGSRWETIPGSVPDPANPVSGCRFHPRCQLSAERARDATRLSIPVSSATGDRMLRRCVERYDGEPSGVPDLREFRPNHFAACWEAGASR
jgi:oligopeptide/dipeptide ABC transporter ATP-binding protein